MRSSTASTTITSSRPRYSRAFDDLSTRNAIRTRANQVFRNAGIWPRLARHVRVEEFTFAGDPLRLDYAYRRNGTRGFVQALPLARDPGQAKVLAFTADAIRAKLPHVEFLAVTEMEPRPEENAQAPFRGRAARGAADPGRAADAPCGMGAESCPSLLRDQRLLVNSASRFTAEEWAGLRALAPDAVCLNTRRAFTPDLRSSFLPRVGRLPPYSKRVRVAYAELKAKGSRLFYATCETVPAMLVTGLLRPSPRDAA